MSANKTVSDRTLSDLGLKLIKAFEGYRARAQTLVTGQRVIGYGHPLDGEDSELAGMTLTRDAALDLLREDLAPVEAMINETVFTPLSQGQFDALCSLVFNIGPVNFMTSNLRHALNNGRALDAANAFDEWRKADIDGRVYVVDALVRRRTAEKALFLRPDTGPMRAANLSMDVSSDDSYAPVSDDEVFSPEAGVTNAKPVLNRRAEDKGGVLTLTERAPEPADDNKAKSVYDPINYADPEHMDAAIEAHNLEIPHPNAAQGEKPSPIAVAAAEVSERLDALIDTARMDNDDAPTPAPKDETRPIAANSNEGKARRPKTDDPDHARKFIEPAPAVKKPANQTGRKDAYGGIYGLFMFIGGCLLAAGLTFWMSARDTMGQTGQFLTPWAIILGGLLLLGGIYYGVRSVFRSRARA